MTEKNPPTKTTPAKDSSPEVSSEGDDGVAYIVYREPYMEGPVQMVKEHRVPISEWPAYEKEHGL